MTTTPKISLAERRIDRRRVWDLRKERSIRFRPFKVTDEFKQLAGSEFAPQINLDKRDAARKLDLLQVVWSINDERKEKRRLQHLF